MEIFRIHAPKNMCLNFNEETKKKKKHLALRLQTLKRKITPPYLPRKKKWVNLFGLDAVLATPISQHLFIYHITKIIIIIFLKKVKYFCHMTIFNWTTSKLDNGRCSPTTPNYFSKSFPKYHMFKAFYFSPLCCKLNKIP